MSKAAFPITIVGQTLPATGLCARADFNKLGQPSGTLARPTVAQLEDVDEATTPAAGDVLTYDGSQWTPDAIATLQGPAAASQRVFSASASADTLGFAETLDASWRSGIALTLLANGGTLPSGVSAGVTYYLIRLNDTTAKLATSYAHAVAATPVAIDLTSDSSGSPLLVVAAQAGVAGQIAAPSAGAEGFLQPDGTFALPNTFKGACPKTLREFSGNAANSQITVMAAPDAWITGAAITVRAGDFALPTGLTDGQAAYLIRLSATTFRLATSAANALAGSYITLSASGSGILESAALPGVAGTITAPATGDDARFLSGSGFATPPVMGPSGVAGSITFGITDNWKQIRSASTAIGTLDFQTGQSVRFTTTGRLPFPLTTDKDFYLLRVGLAGTGWGYAYYVCATLADALAGTNYLEFTTVGSGTHTMTVAGTGQAGYVWAPPATATTKVFSHAGWLDFTGFGVRKSVLFSGVATTKDFTATLSSSIWGCSSHGMSSGQPVTLRTTSTLPSPLSHLTVYWIHAVDADNIKLCPDYISALTGANAIACTNVGSGTHSLAYIVPLASSGVLGVSRTPLATATGDWKSNNTTNNANGLFRVHFTDPNAAGLSGYAAFPDANFEMLGTVKELAAATPLQLNTAYSDAGNAYNRDIRIASAANASCDSPRVSLLFFT